MSEQTLPSSGETEKHADAGYDKALKSRHISMIAIGGAIGTGLFLGAGGRLAQAGPALAIVYAVCGLFAFFVVRSLGELILHRPSSGLFVSYAREFMGEKGAYVAGWMHFLNWSTTGIADITAIALYAHFWSYFAPIPQWALALIALAVVLKVNLVSVKLFGEMAFRFAIVKVAALVLFMIIGIVLLVTQHPVDGLAPGPRLIADHGGIFPPGVLPMILIVQGVVFAYASVELAGVAAGETESPQKIMLVLTAAMSSLNSGLYSTGRILRSMSVAGSAPKFTGVMNRNQVPYGGILLMAAVCVLGVGLNYVVPKDAFEIVLNFAAIGILATWAIIVPCHLLFVRRANRGELTRPSVRLPGSPWTELTALVFLAAVVVPMAFDKTGRITVLALPAIVVALVIGWFCLRKRIDISAFEKADQ
ncbi:L-asparagine permease [Amycolatopsis sp. NPDC023774]|uniref:amino acid permease n=1 Tax=Amycolatopsis sp. NPDC023774 TaxID=3155015 RepID=UPI0033F5C412